MEWPGEQLIIRMWDTLSEKGVGALLRPWQIKRDGIAHIEVRRAELLALAQAEKDAESIRAGHKQLEDFSSDLKFASTSLPPSVSKARTEPTIDLPKIFEIAARQTLEDSARHQNNIAHAIFHAEEALIDDPQTPPSKNIDDDWLYRWRDYAGDVSNESMQSLWGRILAGEVKSPGSFSLRTLEFMRNLSQEEAKIIETISPFVIDDMIWRGDDLAIPFGLLMTAQDLGVISGVESIGVERSLKSIEPSRYERALTANGKIIFIENDDSQKILKLPTYLLTSIGKQVLQLVKNPPNIIYLEKVATAIHNQGFSVCFADITQVTDSMIHFINKKPFKPHG
ncbi:DUF2806 domain-containing protein [Aeromonas caviae]|uniref:DUF2806 domain-containing protein n=1 Tax=Aeromonas caviae TaxID=648 RepID=UPI00191FD595|nr:DUF2806 domain-containing protein [Aeromonas caviae]MBL0554627.1 DUF2806 domain-containing protein [Aeromonas caviae]